MEISFSNRVNEIYFPSDATAVAHILRPGVKPLRMKFSDFANLLYPNHYRKLYFNDAVCVITEERSHSHRVIIPIRFQIYRNGVGDSFVTINNKYGIGSAFSKEILCSIEELVKEDCSDQSPLEIYFSVDNLSIHQTAPIFWSSSSTTSIYSFCEEIVDGMCTRIQREFKYKQFRNFLYTFTNNKVLALYSLEERNLEFIPHNKNFIEYIEYIDGYEGVLDFLEDYIIISQDFPHATWDMWATPDSFILTENLYNDIVNKLKKKYFIDFLCDTYAPYVVPFYRDTVNIIYSNEFLPLDVTVEVGKGN